MANRFPLVIDTTDGNKLKELPAGDNLDLRQNSITRVQNIDALGTVNAADITVNGNRIVAQNFIDLTDTPEDYVDSANKFVKVNATGDALEFRPFSDIGNIEVDEIEVAVQIVPETTGIVNIGTDELYFNRVVANEFKGDLIAGDDTRVFDAGTGKISYAAVQGAPTNLSEFTNDIGYLLAADLDSSLSGLFDEGATFDTDIRGSVFGDDSTMIVDGVASEVVGVVNNTTITTVNLTASNIDSTTVSTNTVQGNTDQNLIINAQNDYNVVIGESNTTNTIIYNGQADGFSFEAGIGIVEYSASTDLILRAGNRIKFADTPVRFSQLTDTEAAYIVAQNGDVIYNTTQNRLQVYQNSAWIDLHKGTFDGNVTTATGESNFNDVVIAGDLTVQGATTSVETTNTTINDNVIVLNNGEVGAGITNTTAGIEIDRGSETNVTFVYDDSADKWTLGSETLVAATFEGNLTGDVVATDIEIDGATSRLTFDSLTAPEIRNGDGSVRVVLFGDDYSPGTAQLYVEANNVWLYSDLLVEQNAVVKGDLTAAAFKGTFVGDDSTVLVDGVAGKVTGEVDTNQVTTTNLNATNIYNNGAGALSIAHTGQNAFSISSTLITVNQDITVTNNKTMTFASGTTIDVSDATVTLPTSISADVTGDLSGNVTGNIDNATLTVGASATTIAIGHSSSTTTIDGDLQLNNALIVNNLVADDSISITTATGDGNAISLGPQGTNTAINLTANSIRFFGPVTTAINATGGIVGDLKGSVVADDSTVIIDSVSGTVYKANVEGSTDWDTAFGWGNHATAGYITSGGSFTGDVKGSVFADDSSVMVDAVNFTMATDVMTLTPLNAEPTNPISGMLAAADGTNWDPASKSGAVSYPVFYDGAAWNALY